MNWSFIVILKVQSRQDCLKILNGAMIGLSGVGSYHDFISDF